MPKFKTTLWQADGKNAVGIVVPDDVIEKLASGKKPKVSVTLKGYTYRSTVGVMGGKYMLPLAAEHRDKIGVKGGDTLEVTVELDSAPREVQMPADFAEALKKAKARDAFNALSFSVRKEYVRAIEEAKAPETRLRRIEKAVADVLSKKK